MLVHEHEVQANFAFGPGGLTEAGAEKYKSILAKAKSLQGLGLPENDAAFASGSTSELVRVAKYKKAKAKKSVKKGKKARASRG